MFGADIDIDGCDQVCAKDVDVNDNFTTWNMDFVSNNEYVADDPSLLLMPNNEKYECNFHYT